MYLYFSIFHRAFPSKEWITFRPRFCGNWSLNVTPRTKRGHDEKIVFWGKHVSSFERVFFCFKFEETEATFYSSTGCFVSIVLSSYHNKSNKSWTHVATFAHLKIVGTVLQAFEFSFSKKFRVIFKKFQFQN